MKRLSNVVVCSQRIVGLTSQSDVFLYREDKKRNKRKQKVAEPSLLVQVLRFLCYWICGGFKFTEFHPSSGDTQSRSNINANIDPEVEKKYGLQASRSMSDRNNEVGRNLGLSRIQLIECHEHNVIMCWSGWK